jgi:hypothetical protein
MLAIPIAVKNIDAKIKLIKRKHFLSISFSYSYSLGASFPHKVLNDRNNRNTTQEI